MWPTVRVRQGSEIVVQVTNSGDMHPGVADDGRVRHRRGVTDVPGLYFIGLSWQHTRGSALLGFVNDDAAHLADRITTHQHATAPADAKATRHSSG